MPRPRPNYSLLRYHGKFIANRDGGMLCFYCGIRLRYLRSGEISPSEHIKRATIDHKVALANGGTSKVENLVLCCEDCNQEKGTMNWRTFYKNASKRNQRRQNRQRNAEIKRNQNLGAASS